MTHANRLLLAMVLGCCAARAETPAASPFERLSPEVRTAAERWLHPAAADLGSLEPLSTGDLRQHVLLALAAVPEAAGFVLSDLPNEPQTTNLLVLKIVNFQDSWAADPDAAGALKALAEKTPDAGLSVAYLDSARRLEMKHLHAILTARLAEARARGDAASLRMLEGQDENWTILERGAMLPAFLRVPPPVFSVVPPGRAIRVVGFGDFGTGSDGQRHVAAAIRRAHAAKPFDFGVTLGDNFYQIGMLSTTDPRWRDWWEALYGPMGITFYPTLGNHEWYGTDGVAAEILYRSPSWRLPAPYYTYTAGPVQFFATDTTGISEEQQAWLAAAIGASAARWKVVLGHHPIFSPESTPSGAQYQHYTQERLWPVIRGRADAYLSGHQHAMARMAPRDGVHFFMAGGGGAPLSPVDRNVPSTRFASSEFGYLTLEADESRLTVSLYDADGNLQDSETLRK